MASLAAKEATLTLSLPARGIEPMERSGQLGADGYWHVRNVPLAVPGRWHVRIDALVTDFRRSRWKTISTCRRAETSLRFFTPADL